MTGFRASASAEPPPGGRVLVCGVNWIGDAVMSMPAVQAFRRGHPDAHLAMLVKPGLAALWTMHRACDEILTFRADARGSWTAARALRRARFDRAFVLPHSFRSAVIPFLAGIPVRIGMPGHHRDFLLTGVRPPRGGADRAHQLFEYFDLLLPGCDPRPDDLRFGLQPEEAARASARQLVAPLAPPYVAVMPGAARGPAKRWPTGYFAEVARLLAARSGVRILLFGGPADRDLCEGIAREVGPAARNLAGQTSVPEWAALLQSCALALANDSGGMHLAAAMGTPVVAVYGRTDPGRTGPLGEGHRILCAEGPHARDIAPDDPAAARALVSVRPSAVRAACEELLACRRATGGGGHA